MDFDSPPIVAAFAGTAMAWKTWQGGEPLSASDLNENFAEIDARVKALEAGRPSATYNGKSYSLDALFCGASTPTLGNLGGHEGAKSLCEFTCSNSPTAHVCSVAELQRSHALGKKATANGFVNGSFGAPNDWGGEMGDCKGWTETNTIASGWVAEPGYVTEASCYGTPQPVLCCD